ncbi:MAG: hypothetical protein V1799_10650 [bacterium]
MNKAIVIKPQNEEEGEFLSRLLKKLGIESSSIDSELMEEYGISLKMKEVDRTKKVSRAVIMRKLRS